MEYYSRKWENLLKSGHQSRFRIYRFDGDTMNKITMIRFWSKNYDTAFEKLREYRKVANKEYTYYIERTGMQCSEDEKGRLVHYDDIHELMNAYRSKRTAFDKIKSWFRVKMMSISDRINSIKDLWYYINHHDSYSGTSHMRHEASDIYGHILDDLEFNLPIIIDSVYSYPDYYTHKIIKEKHKGEKNFDVIEYITSAYKSNNDELRKKIEKECEEVSEEAMTAYKNDMKYLLETVRMYRYIQSRGIIDKSNKEEVELDRKYRSMLPVIKGTYNEMDQKKLDSLEKKYSNRIWNWLLEKGEFLQN